MVNDWEGLHCLMNEEPLNDRVLWKNHIRATRGQLRMARHSMEDNDHNRAVFYAELARMNYRLARRYLVRWNKSRCVT